MATLAFDLEIATRFPGDGRPDFKTMLVSCAATISDLGEVKTYQGPALEGGGYYASMPPEGVTQMVRDLGKAYTAGDTIISFNGLGFDWKLLAYASKSKGAYRACARMALGHYDVMFQALCELGYPIGLAKVAEGFKLHGKLDGMNGALAVPMWVGGATLEEEKQVQDTFSVRCGSPQAQEIVLRYVTQDAKATLDVWKAIVDAREVRWITQKGAKKSFPPGNGRGLLTVRECLALPRPDTSWMTTPMRREDFYSWIPEDLLKGVQIV